MASFSILSFCLEYDLGMKKMSRLTIALLVAIALGVLAGGISSSDAKRGRSGKYKHEDVFQQRQSRDILPFEEVLKIVRSSIKGNIIETEFEIEDGIPIYEIKYIDSNGRVLEIYVDAKTGKILKEEVD